MCYNWLRENAASIVLRENRNMRKKRNRKMLSVILSLAILTGCLSACGSSGSTAEETGQAVEAQVEASEQVRTEHTAATQLKDRIQEAAEKGQEAWNAGIGQYPDIADPDAVRCLQELDRQKLVNSERIGLEKNSDGSYAIGTYGDYPLSEDRVRALTDMLDSVYASGYTMGFIMMDLKTGEGIFFNPEKTYYSASSTKSSFVVSLAAERPDVADRRARELAMIAVNSDNDTYFMLEYDYGQDIHVNYAASVGVDLVMDEGGFADVSAEDLTRLWLADYSYFQTGEKGELVGSWFETPTYSAIVPVVGDKYVSRTKPGWIGGMLHNSSIDAGIVYEDGHPYVIAVMSDFPSYLEDLEETVALLAEIHEDMSAEEENAVNAADGS